MPPNTRIEELREAGAEDVYFEPDQAPAGFWNNLVLRSSWTIAPIGRTLEPGRGFVVTAG
ncbi:MAG TPA: hypothetical protein VIA11_22715 [Acidimicrobiia bacterium]|nr:hypothetical protein [Acidimicrobiia bacterium]